MKEKVLITGASGFIGYHIIEAAITAGLDIYAAVRKSSNIEHLSVFGDKVHFVYPDFNNTDELIRLLEENQFQYIIHAAGLTKARTQEELNRVNANNTVNLFRAAEKAAIPLRKIVFYSSLAAIGPLGSTEGVITEQTVPNPQTAYGKSKLLAESMLKDINIPLITLRPTGVYGPRDRDFFILLQSFKRRMEPYIGRTAQQLTFVYAKDLAGLSVQALFSSVSGEAFNITDGFVYDRYEMGKLAKEYLQISTFKFHVPLGMVKIIAASLETTYGWFGKMPTLYKERLKELSAINWNCSIEKAQQMLNYHPQYDLQKGLKETVLWYKKNKWL